MRILVGMYNLSVVVNDAVRALQRHRFISKVLTRFRMRRLLIPDVE